MALYELRRALRLHTASFIIASILKRPIRPFFPPDTGVEHGGKTSQTLLLDIASFIYRINTALKKSLKLDLLFVVKFIAVLDAS